MDTIGARRVLMFRFVRRVFMTQNARFDMSFATMKGAGRCEWLRFSMVNLLPPAHTHTHTHTNQNPPTHAHTPSSQNTLPIAGYRYLERCKTKAHVSKGTDTKDKRELMDR